MERPAKQRPMFILPPGQSAVPERAATSNLPAYLTPLIGREQEVQAVCALLQRPEVRLLTLTGSGGVGKTRLGVHIATEALNDFADGVCFVSLAPISDPDLVLPALAQTFDLKETPDWLPLEHLKAYLREKQLLLLLDNFEQVIAAAPLLVALLHACPALKMLVTSRARLRVSGEFEFPVLPLALPDLHHLPEHDALLEYAAVALLLQRAQALKPDLQLTAGNARAIAEICLRLDGLPLAIELAAARLKLLSPQALLARLIHRLQVLTAGVQDAPVRQQTLRNTIAWSYDLLDAAEQRLFRRLSVFVSGCTLQAAEAVYGTASDASDGMGVFVLDGVASLIDKSLLQQIEQEGEEPRLMMLETIREYGLEALTASGELEGARRAHAAYYLALAEEVEPEPWRRPRAGGLQRLEQEYENLRAALQWLVKQAEAREDAYTMELALRLGGALGSFWEIRGHASEGRTFLEQALARSEGVTASVRAKAFDAAGWLASLQSDYDRAEVLGEESLALHRELGDAAGIAAALDLLGTVADAKSNYAVASTLFREALALSREAGNKTGIAYALANLAYVTMYQGEYAQAQALAQEFLAISREIGDRGFIGKAYRLLGRLALQRGDETTAQALFEESLAIHRELSERQSIASLYRLLGLLALQRGDETTAQALFEESLAIYRAVGSRQGAAESLTHLARTSALRGEDVAAHALYEESWKLAKELDNKGIMASCLEGLAGVILAQGEAAWAVRLWGAAEMLRETIGAPIPPVERAGYEDSVAVARTQLSESAFTTAWAEGRTMTPEQALAAQGTATIPTTAPAGPPSVPHAPKAPIYLAGLTTREVEVLRLVAQGLTNAQIAEHLIISFHTANAHVRSIYTKLEVTSRSAATRYALEHHLF